MIHIFEGCPPAPLALPVSLIVFLLSILLERLTEPSAFSRAVGRVANVAISLFILSFMYFLFLLAAQGPVQ